jgi:GDP/UDP-N,N'-diacetylbacillosamine 2-epimerase (hydrolysing)
LKPLIREIAKDSSLKLQLAVSGMHLCAEFGLTYREIEKDGYRIDEKVDMRLDSDSPAGIARSMGTGIAGMAGAYGRLRPDMLVVLGDRFEAFSAAAAAMLARIPISHINGGEATYGLVDEAIRHAITKMSHLHFTSTEDYRRRVIQLGEDPGRVFCAGALGLDNIRLMKPMSKEEFQRSAGLKLDKRSLLVTFHPVTLEGNASEGQFGKLLKALDTLRDTSLLFTKANADMFGRVINSMIDRYVARNGGKARAYASMGTFRYLSAMQYVDAVVGNSSSGIIEAPSFRIGTVNIGMRQAGRIAAKSVISCAPEEASIRAAIRKVYSAEFRRTLRSVINPYGDGNAAKRIVRVLREAKLEGILIKRFRDIPLGCCIKRKQGKE